MSKRTVLVTGACGFIGGAICIELKIQGYTVIGIDLVRREHLMPFMDAFFQADFDNIPTFIWSSHGNYDAILNCDTIIHCAGKSLVGPSIKTPMVYYNNNVIKTIRLIDWCATHEKHFMFSSSASVYKTQNRLISEEDPLEPLSPYAKSKRMVEDVVKDFTDAYGLRATIFRYFNACGAVDDLHGQPPGESHIFPKLFECENTFELNGTNFNTRDGSCVRDYVHITDIARAHILAIEQKQYGIYNLGSSLGYSNLEIIKTVGKPYRDVGRRQGDPDCLIADINQAKRQLGWLPQESLPDIISSLKMWYKSSIFKGMKNGITINSV